MTDDFFDLETVDWDEVEQGSEPVPEGWYRARVQEVDEDINSANVLFQFKIVNGPHRGRMIKDTLFHPSSAGDADKERRSKNRRLRFAKMLGLISEADIAAKKKVTVKWTQTLHKEVFIKVVHNQAELKDKVTKKPTGKMGTFANLAWDGVWALTDERVPAEVRKANATSQSQPAGAGAGAGAGTGSSASAGQPASSPTAPRDYGDALGLGGKYRGL